MVLFFTKKKKKLQSSHGSISIFWKSVIGYVPLILGQRFFIHAFPGAVVGFVARFTTYCMRSMLGPTAALLPIPIPQC